MKLGLHIAETSWRGGAPALRSNLKTIVQTAEAAGFDAIDVADHVWQSHYLGGDLESEVEAYTTLGFIAAHTERVRLLALATAASYRPPGLLAKMVTTLDVLSGGRMMLGIGAGDYEEEAVGLGLPYPSLRERFEILEDTVQVCLRMWDGERGDEQPFEGTPRPARPRAERAAEPQPAPPADPHRRRAARSGPCRSSPATPTRATSRRRPRSRASSTSCAACATRPAATTTRSRRRRRSASTSARTARRRARS